MEMHHIRRGSGRPLVLIHGLGGSWRSWAPILDRLASEREVIAVDLPGFGDTPALSGEASIATLADAVTSFLAAQQLEQADVVGSSMGARLVLELARRGAVGATVALSPGGFWSHAQLRYFELSIGASIRLVRLLQPVMARLTASTVGRTVLFAQLSARPWRLPADVTLAEMRSFAASPSFDAVLHQLVHGPPQLGTDSTPGPVTIGWGRQDPVCLPSQAGRAQALFPRARLEWFDGCGHFPQWDVPEQAARLILERTGQGSSPE